MKLHFQIGARVTILWLYPLYLLSCRTAMEPCGVHLPPHPRVVAVRRETPVVFCLDGLERYCSIPSLPADGGAEECLKYDCRPVTDAGGQNAPDGGTN